MLKSHFIKTVFVCAALSTSTLSHAASFNFADIANGDSSYGATGGEYGATSIDFVKDGISLTASGSDVVSGAIYNAYLDSSWTHSGGGGNGGLGVCKELSGDQCNPGSDDNVTINENLMLTFDGQVIISEITFRNGEHNPVFASDATFGLVIDRGLGSESSSTYSLEYIFSTSLTGSTFEFLNLNTLDTDDYRFYISAMEVSAVPVPAAVWLFASGLLGLIATARRKA